MNPALLPPSASRRAIWTVGLAVEMLALSLYTVVASQVVSNGALVRLDYEWKEQLNSYAWDHPGLTSVFLRLTDLGSVPGIASVTLAVAVLLCWRGRYRLALIWILAVGSGALCNSGLKTVYQRPRPFFEVGKVLVLESTYSFASGHSSGSLVCYGFLAYLLLRFLPRKAARAAVSGLILLILAIGFSRMYLGAHYFTDVAGGFALGLAWLTPWLTALEINRRRQPTGPAEKMG